MSAQAFQQVQKMAQSQVLAPQLRQSLKILQSAALELRNVILEELQTNPTLEELPIEGISLEATGDQDGEKEAAGDGTDELRFGENFEILRKLDEDWRELYAEENDQHSYHSEDEERRQYFFDSLTTETSLQEHLIHQAELTDASPAVLKSLEYLIGSLDDNGFLSVPLSDLALTSGLPMDDLQAAAQLLKTLEPAGIGAQNLQECLLLQLQAAGKSNGLAWQIVRKHYDLLLKRRIPDIARKLEVEKEQVEEAVEEIGALDPAPGRKFAEDKNRVVVADVVVERDDAGEFIIHLNNDYIPRLRISSTYKDLIAKGNLSAEEKEYLQEKLRSGKFLISSIEQRQQTIERITRELLVFQREFFLEGPAKLRPLTMSQVAASVGVHETTVSRAIANKFIQTEYGLFEFKYFFTPGYRVESGEEVSNTTVKEEIRKIIEGEPPTNPYSDQDIVEILAQEGITIARRTVAKYREELGILPTHMRRRYG